MTEKSYAPTKTEKKVSQKVEVPKIVEEPKKMTQAQEKQAEKIEEQHEDKENKNVEKKGRSKTSTSSAEASSNERKKQPAKKIKKDEVAVNANGVHVSTKYAIAICEFIRRKKVEKAIEELEEVLAMKRHIPMRGEYAHKKGKGKVASGAGKYPQYATEQFIVLLKSLLGNANNHDVEEPVIVEAVANFGDRPLGRFGRWSRKRTKIHLVAREAKKTLKRNKNLKRSKKSKKKVGGKK